MTTSGAASDEKFVDVTTFFISMQILPYLSHQPEYLVGVHAGPPAVPYSLVIYVDTAI